MDKNPQVDYNIALDYERTPELSSGVNYAVIATYL